VIKMRFGLGTNWFGAHARRSGSALCSDARTYPPDRSQSSTKAAPPPHALENSKAFLGRRTQINPVFIRVILRLSFT
jgi:hypothetical protein